VVQKLQTFETIGAVFMLWASFRLTPSPPSSFVP